MNEVLLNILNRRSMRNFSPEQIPDDSLNAIIQAAIHAPSGGNSQSWRFTVLQNAAKLEILNLAVREAFNDMHVDDKTYISKVNLKKAALNPDYNFYYQAPTLIVISNVRDYGNAMADCSAALENILLAAHSLGLGSCWINQLTWFGDNARVRSQLDNLGIPADHIVCGAAAIGYSSGPVPAVAPRKDGTVCIVK